MKTQTIGVEIEFTGITRKAAAIATLCFTFYEERIQPELTEGLK